MRVHKLWQDWRLLNLHGTCNDGPACSSPLKGYDCNDSGYSGCDVTHNCAKTCNKPARGLYAAQGSDLLFDLMHLNRTHFWLFVAPGVLCSYLFCPMDREPPSKSMLRIERRLYEIRMGWHNRPAQVRASQKALSPLSGSEPSARGSCNTNAHWTLREASAEFPLLEGCSSGNAAKGSSRPSRLQSEESRAAPSKVQLSLQTVLYFASALHLKTPPCRYIGFGHGHFSSAEEKHHHRPVSHPKAVISLGILFYVAPDRILSVPSKDLVWCV